MATIVSTGPISRIGSDPSRRAQAQIRARLGGSRPAALIYKTAIRYRRALKPLLRYLTTPLDRVLWSSRIGDWALELACSQSKKKRRRPARLTLAIVRWTLLASAMLYVGASQRTHATKCARIINLLFRSEVLSRRGVVAKAYFQLLLLIGWYEKIAEAIPRPEKCDSFIVNLAAGSAHLYLKNQATAQYFLSRAIEASNDSSHEARRRLGSSYLLAENEPAAAREFERCVEIFPPAVMAHHNNAARYDIPAYRPKTWELDRAGELLIYDNFVRLGEDFYLLGRFEDSMRAYQRAFRQQQKLAQSASLPKSLLQALERTCPRFDPARSVRLLGYEWVTQIGHMGFLDWHMRMVRLGMLPDANYVLLAPPAKTANAVMLDYLEAMYCAVRDADLVDELFPYQRLVGDHFIAVCAEGELAEPWAHAAARAQCMWAERGLPPQMKLSEQDREFGRDSLARLGLPPEAWYVGLHVREGGFHGDGRGTTLAHRIASIDDYMPAIAEIVSRGGWVLRLGDASMQPLPPMPGVVDYARSAEKSARMDIVLMATSRFVIGTTSGLTTATQAFGTPMLLVNCISNDCQFWTSETDFVLKRVYDKRRRRYLTLAESYRQPFQARLINATILAQRGYEVHGNSAEEIRAAVAYKLDCLDGTTQRMSVDHPLMRQYRAAMMENPYNFGSALPARPFLEAHPELLMGAETPFAADKIRSAAIP